MECVSWLSRPKQESNKALHTRETYNTSFLCTKSAEVGRGGGGGGGVLPLPINPPNFSLFFFEAVTGFYGISTKKRKGDHFNAK